MDWRLVRLDDRLLHGQVAVGWVGALHPRILVVADDRLAASSWERELVESAAPEGVEVRVMPLGEAARVGGADAGQAILLLRGPLELSRAMLAGLKPSAVNVGGLHTAQGRTRVLDYVHLNAEEARALREAASAGVRLYAQDVPGNPSFELIPHLDRAGL